MATDISRFIEGFMQGFPAGQGIRQSMDQDYWMRQEDLRRRQATKDVDLAAEEEEAKQESMAQMLMELLGYGSPAGYEFPEEMQGRAEGTPRVKPTAVYESPYGTSPMLESMAGMEGLGASDMMDMLSRIVGLTGQPVFEPEEEDTVNMSEMGLIVPLMRGEERGYGFTTGSLRDLGEQTGQDFEQEMAAYAQNPEMWDELFPAAVDEPADFLMPNRYYRTEEGGYEWVGTPEEADDPSPLQYREGLVFDPDTGAIRETQYYDPTGGEVDMPSITSTVTNMRTNGTYNLAVGASDTYGVPLEVLLAVFSKESGGNTQAVGDGGDSYGIGQLNRVNWEAFDITDPQAFLNDPARQVEIAATMLKDGFERTGSWRDALRMYNGSGPMAEAYADDVWARSQEIKDERDMMPEEDEDTISSDEIARWWVGVDEALGEGTKAFYTRLYMDLNQSQLMRLAYNDEQDLNGQLERIIGVGKLKNTPYADVLADIEGRIGRELNADERIDLLIDLGYTQNEEGGWVK